MWPDCKNQSPLVVLLGFSWFWGTYSVKYCWNSAECGPLFGHGAEVLRQKDVSPFTPHHPGGAEGDVQGQMWHGFVK